MKCDWLDKAIMVLLVLEFALLCVFLTLVVVVVWQGLSLGG